MKMDDKEAITLLASGGEDVKLWDLSTTVPLQQFSEHADGISSLCWSHNNHFLASSSSVGDKVVLNYIKGSSTSVTELAAGEKQTCIALNSSSRYLACGGRNRTITVWDLKTKKMKKQYKGHKDAISCIIFNWNDTHIASGSSSGEVLIHNVVSGQCGSPLTTPTRQPIRNIQYSFFKKAYLAAVSDDGSLYLWDTNTNKLLTTFNNAHKAPATALAFSPLNNLLLASCGLDKRILCYDIMSKKVIKTMTVDAPLTSLAFMHDGATLACGSSRGKIFIFDLRKGAVPIKTLLGHKSSVQSLCFQFNVSSAKVNGTVNKIKSTPGQSAGGDIKKSTKVEYTPETHIIPTSRTHGVISLEAGGEADNKQHSLKESLGTSDSFGTLVISPLLDDKKKERSSSFTSERPDVLGTESSSSNNSLTAGGIFSPLPSNNSGTDVRKTPIGSSVGHSPNPYPTTQPMTSNILDRVGLPINVNNNTSSPLAVFSPPQSTASKTGTAPSILDMYQRNFSADSILDDNRPTGITTDPASYREVSTERSKHSDRSPRRGSAPQFSPLSNSVSQSRDVSVPQTTPPLADNHPKEGPQAVSRTDGPPVEAFQVEFIRNMIEDSLEEFRVAVHRDIMNLQLEMLRQFQIQQNEIQALLQTYSVNEGLLAEVERLREENKRLKSTF